MKAVRPTPELRIFRDFLNEKLKNGGADLSPEEALDEFRRAHDPLEYEDDVAAIQAAIDDLERGERGMPIEDSIANFERNSRF